MLEKHIVAKIKAYLATIPNGLVIKNHGGLYGVAGLPDIFFFVQPRHPIYKNPATECFAFEVKQPGKKATMLQQVMLDKLRAVGFVAGVVCSVQDVKNALALKGMVV